MIEITSTYLASQGLSPTFQKRFWAKVRKTDSCWLWTASLNNKGYGRIGKWHVGDPTFLAHIASWILHFGPVPNGLCVLHSCDTPACVRPDHLWLGTQAANIADMMRKGRNGFKRQPGENHWKHKVTSKQVLEIRTRFAAGGITQQALADEFGLSQPQISVIVRHAGWKEVIY